MKLYIPMWFNIKSICPAVDGATNVHKILVTFNKLPEATQIIKPVIQRNVFFAHPENIIITMLQYHRIYIIKLAWRRIKNARSTEREQIRQFTKPQLSFSGKDYTHMTDWNESEISEPPLRTQMKEKRKLNVERFPCHTQAVEWLIKLQKHHHLFVEKRQKMDSYEQNSNLDKKSKNFWDENRSMHNEVYLLACS